ncbi:MAG: PKD domain-containing protein [Myxococcota bacterium]
MRLPLLLIGLSLVAACNNFTKGDGDGDTTGGNTDAKNGKPVAEAGNPITQSADSAVSLNGSASYDPDGDSIIWTWSFDSVPSGSALATREAPISPNHSAEAIGATFSPDAVGTYVVKLVVEDSHGLNSDPDYVIITISEPENIPVANAGTDVSTQVGTPVALDGSRSYDPLGRSLTYAWTIVDKPSTSTASLANETTATPSFTPDVRGVYVANLVVSNGLAISNSDAVSITATGEDNAPTANAGTDQTVEDCTTITLDCSSSVDPDGDTLQYVWEVQSKPSGSDVTNATFSDRTSATPTFYPDEAGVYVLSCAVFDGTTWSTPDATTITAAERRSNTRPVADAGANVTVSGGSATCTESGYVYICDECSSQVVTLGDLSTVSDPDGDPYSVVWTVVSGDATIADPNTLVTTVTLEDAEPEEPGECSSTEYEFQLEVTDCTGATSTDTTTFVVECCGVEDTAR